MTISISERAKRIKPSPTLSLTVKVNQLKAEGHDIINLGLGEPDFDTPQHIKDASIKATLEGFTKYTAVDGIAPLKQAIIDKFAKENHLHYDMKQVMVASGSKQTFYNLAQALLNDGDEVIIPAPYWVSYPDMVYLAGGVPVYIKTTAQQHFKMTPEQLEKAITPKTKLLVINSPSNPSGMVYSKDELAALAKVLLRHPQVVIVSDDMYEHIQWSGAPFYNIVNACPELFSRTMVLNGVSKSYAMTGWRIGYCAGPQEIIKAMTNIQAQSTSNANAMAQVASVEALKGPQHCVQEMQDAYHQRSEFMVKELQSIPGVKCLPTQGTFYIFPDMSELITRMPNIDDDLALAEFILTEAKVAVIPGSAFGTPGCMRLSCVANLDTLHEAMKRIHKALA